MRKSFIIFVNVIIMAAILMFVVLYSGYAHRDFYRRQIEYFENTTVTMEQVTENYLEGEQRICDVWARYINNNTMTIEEAAGYIRASHVLENTSAHLVFADTLAGSSTRPRQGSSDDYDVSYERIDLLKGTDWSAYLPLPPSLPKPDGQCWDSCRLRICMWIMKTGCCSESFPRVC